jgi:hypothetical protein
MVNAVPHNSSDDVSLLASFFQAGVEGLKGVSNEN